MTAVSVDWSAMGFRLLALTPAIVALLILLIWQSRAVKADAARITKQVETIRADIRARADLDECRAIMLETSRRAHPSSQDDQ